MSSILPAIGWRAGQQAGVQAIYFLRLLVLARLLAPEAFGQLALRHRLQLGLSVWLHPADTEREGPGVVNDRAADRSATLVEGTHDARA
jgi:hypothetical protein